MNTEVYFFSGTGNSLSVARDIAQKIKGALISIPSVIAKESIRTEAESIVIVFPSYMAQLHGVPLMVESFIKKLENIGSKHVFAVCTCGGYEIVNALPTLKNFARFVKSIGGRLSGEYSVRLPMNNLDYDHIPIPINKDQESMFKKCRQKTAVICGYIVNKRKTKHRIVKSLFNSLMAPLYRMMHKAYLNALIERSKEPKDTSLEYYEMIPLTDKSIYVDEKCNGCSICAKVCPAQNIKIIEKKPVWQHHCEMCLACDEWCPTKAIHHWCKHEGIDYHHPEVKVSDMLRQN